MGLKLVPLLVVLTLVVLLFGTSRLRNIGTDLAEAIKSFRRGLKEEDKRDRDDRN